MGKDTFAISAYLKGSVRKCEVMRTQEHKRSVKNGANINGVKTCASSSWEIEKETMLQKGGIAGYNAE